MNELKRGQFAYWAKGMSIRRYVMALRIVGVANPKPE